MPVYEYRCEQCTHQFEATQSVHARPEDTVCPQCNKIGATRMLAEFSKLPPAMGKRIEASPDFMAGAGGPAPTEGHDS